MTTHTTANFALPYIDSDSPLADLADVSEQMAQAIDAALLAGPASLPGAQDLTQLAARVVALENARTVLEARTTFTTATVPTVSGWSNPAGFPPLTVQKDGMGRVRLDGMRSNNAAFTPSGTQVIGVLPAGYRPAQTRFYAIPTNEAAGAMVQVDVRTDGQILAVRGAAVSATRLWTFDSVAFQAAP